MTLPLCDLPVLALDCQASGATPAHGDLLELGWAVCGAGALAPVQSRWIVPRTERPIRRAIRELTGWTEACLASAVEEAQAWAALLDDTTRAGLGPAPTVIHYARFEIPFLKDLHDRLGPERAFPFDAICLHAVAARLFPDLPRRNIRALAGYLGHSPELLRRSAGHVEATAFIWRALVPLLEKAGVGTWRGLKTWLQETPVAPRGERRVYPFGPERRRTLPDGPGVYRFLRRSGDVLYVGKATSLRKRVASHFKGRGSTTERALELLTQVHDVQYTETTSLLEAAVLETDEIKRLDPPYNIQLRHGERSAWFACRDLSEAVSVPDDAHPIGPLPSEGALMALRAMVSLAAGADSPRLRAGALSVPMAFLPDEALFAEGWDAFLADHLLARGEAGMRPIARASLELWLQRGRAEPDTASEDAPPDHWDLARIRRRLERNLVQSGLLLRRAPVLTLLVDSTVAFQERPTQAARVLVISRGTFLSQGDIEEASRVSDLPARRPGTLRERQASFDASTYDRMRVLLTELRRIQVAGGRAALRVAGHTFAGARLERLLRAV